MMRATATQTRAQTPILNPIPFPFRIRTCHTSITQNVQAVQSLRSFQIVPIVPVVPIVPDVSLTLVSDVPTNLFQTFQPFQTFQIGPVQGSGFKVQCKVGFVPDVRSNESVPKVPMVSIGPVVPDVPIVQDVSHSCFILFLNLAGSLFGFTQVGGL